MEIETPAAKKLYDDARAHEKNWIKLHEMVQEFEADGEGRDNFGRQGLAAAAENYAAAKEAYYDHGNATGAWVAEHDENGEWVLDEDDPHEWRDETEPVETLDSLIADHMARHYPNG